MSDEESQVGGYWADPEHDEAGLDLARSVAKTVRGSLAASAQRPARRRTQSSSSTFGPRISRAKVSGAHPDDRDPQLLDATLARFVGERGWDVDLRVHGVFGRWPEIVGEEVASHCRPESFADGRLVVRTDSTAWATQLKLLAATVVRRLNEELGHGTVIAIEVLGPHVPTWTKGRFSVPGRGPRDTYG